MDVRNCVERLTSASKIQILFEIIDSGQCNGIAIKVIQPIHRPQHGHDPSVKLLDESDLLRVGLFVSARVVDAFDLRNRFAHLRVRIGLLALEKDDASVLVLLAGVEGSDWRGEAGHGEMNSTEFGEAGGVSVKDVVTLTVVVTIMISMLGACKE